MRTRELAAQLQRAEGEFAASYLSAGAWLAGSRAATRIADATPWLLDRIERH